MNKDTVFTLVQHDKIVSMTRGELLVGYEQGLVIYFYPKDNTPGCTLESQDFSAMREQFVALGYGVVGVSKDSDTSHTKFIDKCNLQIPLISDGNLVIHKYFDTIGEKKMFGKTYHGTIRSTFVVDTDGITLHERRKVKARGHAQTVYDTLAHTS